MLITHTLIIYYYREIVYVLEAKTLYLKNIKKVRFLINTKLGNIQKL
jgi:hypothetical protein